jgi:hypothetical protein
MAGEEADMGEQTRRSFVTGATATLGGAALLAAADLETTPDDLAAAPSDIPSADYWRLVQRQFRLEPGLHYLNNASLGPSPALVADATESYRRRLDAYPPLALYVGRLGGGL